MYAVPACLSRSLASVPKSISGPPGVVCRLAGATPTVRDVLVGGLTAIPAARSSLYSNQSLAVLTVVVPVVGMTGGSGGRSRRSIAGGMSSDVPVLVVVTIGGTPIPVPGMATPGTPTGKLIRVGRRLPIDPMTQSEKIPPPIGPNIPRLPNPYGPTSSSGYPKKVILHASLVGDGGMVPRI